MRDGDTPFAKGLLTPYSGKCSSMKLKSKILCMSSLLASMKRVRQKQQKNVNKSYLQMKWK